MRSDQWMLSQLPVGMTSDDFFTRFVSIFQEEAGTLLAHADNLEHLVDPSLAPPQMVRWIATWIGLAGLDPGLPDDSARKLVATASSTLGWRGTKSGLTAILEAYSGGPVHVQDGGGVWREGEAPADPAWVVMSVASTGGLTEEDFVALLADHVPAQVRAELWVGDRLVWPQPSIREVVPGD
ncbi:phage tail protein [Actinotalea sp. K2]|uniref:phage tail protein n=1 Tax=Actinotalea sp. K2 TaxID=2939438 RepID=UPI0020182397|nr:phage tail protein [Actinotalea sp. K2]MCL3861861.1 phage tail protein [Actinotalea sp. K2]